MDGMLTKTKAQKVVDEWYKLKQTCTPEKCKDCEFDKSLFFVGEQNAFFRIPMCYLFERMFAEE